MNNEYLPGLPRQFYNGLATSITSVNGLLSSLVFLVFNIYI